MSAIQETFKPVVGYEGYYEINQDGVIRSVTITRVNSADRFCTYVAQTIKRFKETLDIPQQQV